MYPLVVLAALLCASQESDSTFQTKVNLVLVPVVVRDSAGHTVGHLTQEDFELFDKRKRQTISSFSVVERAGGAGTVHGTEPSSLGRSDAVVVGGNSRPERYIVYVFDDLNTDFAIMAGLREAALRHFSRGMPVTDRAAISTFSRRTTMAFTTDQAKIEDTVQK